jgi:hypothetical protein
MTAGNLYTTMSTSFNSAQARPSSSLSTHAEKRANHNAVERARRESLNIRFLELAQFGVILTLGTPVQFTLRSIPSLVHVRKPSKAFIVSRSIEYLAETKQRLEIKNRSLHLIRQQNEEFKLEINRLRQKLGLGAVGFPDNIDLDLVFEANLEHQKESENMKVDNSLSHQMNHPTSMQMAPGSMAMRKYGMSPSYGHNPNSYRSNSPFDLITTWEEDDDDRQHEKRGSFSALSPLSIDRHDSRQNSGKSLYFI